MGLDWIPMRKPKSGFEERFKQIYKLLEDLEHKKRYGRSWLDKLIDKLRGKKVENEDELLQEWEKISEDHYETIKAPMVGRDKIADHWIKEKYQKIDKATSAEECIKKCAGYYVVALAKELDGVPAYIAAVGDDSGFRGKFLETCQDLIGEDLLTEGWESKLADETLHYGQQLMAIADKAAAENNMLYLKEQYGPPCPDCPLNLDENKESLESKMYIIEGEESLESKIHIIYAAAKWLIFYGKNGHGFHADF